LVGTELPAVGLAQLDAGDLGNRVPLVGRLQRAGQQILLAHGLGRELRIDARGAEEQKFLHIGRMGGADEVEADRQVVGEEGRRIGAVGADAADPPGGEKHRVGPRPRQPLLGLILVCEVDGGMIDGENLAAFPAEPPRDGGAGHAGVARDVNALAGKIELERRAHAGVPPV
jgi:hypothetical protein